MSGSSAPGSGTEPTTGQTTSTRVVYGAAGTFHGPVTVNGRTVVALPHQVGALPPLAVDRLERPVDAALQTAVDGGGAAAVVCQVLAGLGGVGKTQLAASLAHRWWRDRRVDLLVWVTATSRTAVLTRYAQAAADVTGVADRDPNDGAQRLLGWLASSRARWLVVLDDLTDPADLRGLWPPVSATGRTVVTTRRRDSALLDGRTLIDVDLFTANEAVDYLRIKLGGRPHRFDQAAELADDLGRLPLALAQAVAYILDQDLTCADYRRRLTRHHLHALRPATLPDDQHTAVADTWALSIDLADAATGGIAGILLQLAALLDPNGIPHRLFTTTAVIDYCSNRTTKPVEDDAAHDALHALHRLSLVAATNATGTDTSAVRIHALLQRVVRESTLAEHEHNLAITAADAINELWPDHEPDAGAAQSLRANTTTLYHHAHQHLWAIADTAHPILFRAGTSLGEIGLVATARDYFHHLHVEAGQHLGSDHPDTLAAHHVLAYWRGEAGDPSGAAAAFGEVLSDRQRVLGLDHPDTLAARHYLAYWQAHAGNPRKALETATELMSDRRRVLGPEHRDTLDTRHNIAYWRGESGNVQGAVAAFADLLADRARILGPDDPDTLATRQYLAYWRGQAGDPRAAVTAFTDLILDRGRVLGPYHPHTLTTRQYLAHWRGEAGDATAAISAFEDLLPDVLEVLGTDHPRTLNIRRQLAEWRAKAGDIAAAIVALEELLPDMLRVLGPDHPYSLSVRHNLAHWRPSSVDRTG